jgi:hypothetical protein
MPAPLDAERLIGVILSPAPPSVILSAAKDLRFFVAMLLRMTKMERDFVPQKAAALNKSIHPSFLPFPFSLEDQHF